MRFLESTLADWQMRWGHESIDGEILYNGELITVAKAFELGALVTSPGAQPDDLGCAWRVASGWRYCAKGLEPISATEWESLSPCESRPADGCWYVEVIATAENLNHGHLRLIDAQGQVISVGFSGDCSFPFSWKRGEIRCPDQREVLNRDHRLMRVQLDEQQYATIVRYIEDCQHGERLAFQVQERNCTVFVAECLEQAGIRLNHKEFMTQAAARAALRYLSWRPPLAILKLAACAMAIGRFLLTPLWLAIWLASGSWKVSPEAQTAYAKTFSRPLSWRERLKRLAVAILTVSYLKFYTGWKLGVWLDRMKELASDRPSISVAEACAHELPSVIAMAEPNVPSALQPALPPPAVA